MDEKEILKTLALPKKAQVLRTFPFNRLAQHLTASDRNFFQNAVETHGVRLLATVNTNTTNIPVYEEEDTTYQEIHFFQIKTKDLKSAKRVYRIIAEAMPYPLFIRFIAGHKVIWIGAAHQKIANTGLLKMQKLYSTDPEIEEQHYLKHWAFPSLDKYHLKGFYEALLKQIISIELEETYESVINSDLESNATRLETIKKLEKEIATCISKAKKETQMNKRIEWQMKANKLKDEKEKYIKGEI